jgi:hypothetical protein
MRGRAASYEVAVDGRAFQRASAEAAAVGETAWVVLQSRPKAASVRAVDDRAMSAAPPRCAADARPGRAHLSFAAATQANGSGTRLDAVFVNRRG